MKRTKTMKILILMVVVLGAHVSALKAQVKIGDNSSSNTIQEGSILELESTNKALLLPRLTSEQRNTISNPIKGMIIYNTDKDCVESFLGLENGIPQWDCLCNMCGQSQNIAVTGAGFTGTYLTGTSLNSANTVKFRLENTGSTAISNVDFSNAVTIQNGGATITVDGSANSSVSLASGEDIVLTYTLDGSPEIGTLTAFFDGSGVQANQNTTVGAGGSATIADVTVYVFSLTYGGATEVQGIIDNETEALTIDIPYTNGQGAYGEVDIQPIDGTLGEGEDRNKFSLNIPAGNFSANNGSLAATIRVDGDGKYFVKQQLSGEEYTIVSFPINMAGTTYNVIVKGLGGIPDRNFGDGVHDFVYVPITGEDGEIWLSNNLGANYADMNNDAYNFVQQATSSTDYHAYGSLYQWGRLSDGHEIINHTAAAGSTAEAGTTGTQSQGDIPVNSNFITIEGDWRSSSNDNLWQGVSGINNPCPEGYRLPTNTEWTTYITDAGINSAADAASVALKLPFAGLRVALNGNLSGIGNNGFYWSSSASTSASHHSYYKILNNPSASRDTYRADGLSVRCIKAD